MISLKRAALPSISKGNLPYNFKATRFRNWIDVAQPTSPKISVMSYNLLSQHYVWSKVFGYLDQRYLDWNQYRLPLINQTISQFGSDIICFQELECKLYTQQWRKHFPLRNYDLFYVRKPKPAYWGTKPTEHMDGVGIFINKDRFDILNHREIIFRDYILQHQKRFELTEDLRDRVILRNTVGLLLKLRDKISNKTVYVANTHLYWLPKFNDVKLLQTKLLMNEIQRFIAHENNTSEKANIIICGDFNSTPDLMVYKFLKGGVVDLQNSPEFEDRYYGRIFDGEKCAEELHNTLEVSSAYGALLEAGSPDYLDFTTFTGDFAAVLDHIWLSSNNLQVCKVLGKVDPDYRNSSLGFPDKNFPSDHIPLVTELSYL